MKKIIFGVLLSILFMSNGTLHAASLGFGDGTGAANAQWQMTAYTFEQTTVPLPSAALFLGIGLVGLCAAARRN